MQREAGLHPPRSKKEKEALPEGKSVKTKVVEEGKKPPQKVTARPFEAVVTKLGLKRSTAKEKT